MIKRCQKRKYFFFFIRAVLKREKGDYKYRLEKEDFVFPSFIEGLLEKGIIIKEGEALIKLTFFRERGIN
ncbi:MAG: hypothetical protein B6D55_03690 [Candidatus Omnitrophica bacterium 4484_70.2]|nr:MAG: hypothetical protein B6D55_03690 [Candidatus Omnitrophica bacterium 4484_70.2]